MHLAIRTSEILITAATYSLCMPPTGRPDPIQLLVLYGQSAIDASVACMTLVLSSGSAWISASPCRIISYLDLDTLILCIESTYYGFANFKFEHYPNWSTNSVYIIIIFKCHTFQSFGTVWLTVASFNLTCSHRARAFRTWRIYTATKIIQECACRSSLYDNYLSMLIFALSLLHYR